jgi:signal transduction histidine kinase
MATLRSIGRALGHMDPLLIDGMAALIIFVSMAVKLASPGHLPAGQHPTTPLDWALAVLIVAPIVTHRRFPRTSVAVCLTAVVGYAALRPPAYPGVAIFVLLFDITLHSRRRVVLTTLFASAVVITLSLRLQPGSVASTSTWVTSELGIAVAWLAAENLRYRRARWSELQARAERLEREREEEARRAVTEERLRIARELHDVITHSLSLITVKASVANYLVESRPEEVRATLTLIETTGRGALTEMRRMLGVLRADSDTGQPVTGDAGNGRAPAPGLAELAALAEHAAEAGVHVDLDVPADHDLPEGVPLAAYRIVQEALTNVVKHAAPTRCRVRVSRTGNEVLIDVTDDGPGRNSRPAAAAGGHGIVGMRERAALFGGELEAAPGPHGGFRVTARLPCVPAIPRSWPTGSTPGE